MMEDDESIGMWSMYAQPWRDGIKISIPKDILKKWVSEVDEIIERKKQYIKEREEQREKISAEKKALYEARLREEEAKKAEAAALNLFAGGGAAEVPSVEISASEIENGINIMDMLVITKLAPSKSEARRNVQQGGVSVREEKISDINFTITKDMFENNELMIRRGKKAFIKVIIQ